MSHDEARHGKALMGLLQRYFAVDNAKEKAAAAANKAGEKATEVAGAAAAVVGDAVSQAAEALNNLLKK